MREIKFRAWDMERKDMRQIQLMDWSDWWVSTGHTWEREKGLEYGERNSFKNEETDRHILMQYTGLKDKNGKEIYEGDIVHCISQWDAADMVVIFEEGEFRMVLCEKYKDYFTGGGFYAVRTFNKEVIGNIYEHAHLLPQAIVPNESAQ